MSLDGESRVVRPPTPDSLDQDALAAYVDDRATAVDGRLGVLLGRPRGPTLDDFEALAIHGADRPYASASVVKLVVLYALYRTHDGDLDALDERSTIAPENRVGGAGLLHLLDGPELSLRDLARAMVAVSDNAATNELVDRVGMDAVDDVVVDLGLEHSRLGRKMMTIRGDSDEAGADPVNTTSPWDCARLFADLLHGDRLSERAREEQLGLLRNQKDVSLFPRYHSRGADLAHKTGRLPDAALDTGLVEGYGDGPLFFAAFCDRAGNGGDAADVVAEVGDAAFTWLRDGAA